MDGFVDWGECPERDRLITACPAGDGDYPSYIQDVWGNPLNGEIRVQIWQISPERLVTPNEAPLDDVRLRVSRTLSGSWGDWSFISHATYYEDGVYVFASPWFISGTSEIEISVVAFTSLGNWESDLWWSQVSPRYHVITPDVSGDPPGSMGYAGEPDGLVNLPDVQVFAYDFYGFYNKRSDYVFDGAINLSDLTFLTAHQGHQHPYWSPPRQTPDNTPSADEMTSMILGRDPVTASPVPREDQSSLGQLKSIYKN